MQRRLDMSEHAIMSDQQAYLLPKNFLIHKVFKIICVPRSLPRRWRLGLVRPPRTKTQFLRNCCLGIMSPLRLVACIPNATVSAKDLVPGTQDDHGRRGCNVALTRASTSGLWPRPSSSPCPIPNSTVAFRPASLALMRCGSGPGSGPSSWSQGYGAHPDGRCGHWMLLCREGRHHRYTCARAFAHSLEHHPSWWFQSRQVSMPVLVTRVVGLLSAPSPDALALRAGRGLLGRPPRLRTRRRPSRGALAAPPAFVPGLLVRSLRCLSLSVKAGPSPLPPPPWPPPSTYPKTASVSCFCVLKCMV